MSNPIHDDLYILLSSVQNKKEAEKLLIDLLSPAEIENIAERWHIMQQIAAGHSHRAIAKSVDTSIAKVSRCARVVWYGNGAVVEWLRRLGKPMKISRGKKTGG